MAVSTSAIPTFTANLLTQLKARSALATVQVVDGGDFLPDPQREFISLGDVTWEQDWRLLGGAVAPSTRTKREQFDLEITIWVQQEATDQAAAVNRAFALMAEIETQIRTDPTVNGACIVAQVRRGRLRKLANEGQRGARLTCFVRCDYSLI